MFWLILFLVLLIIAIGGIIYLFRGFHRFSFIKKLAERHRLLSWLLCLLPFGGIACFGFINSFTVIVVIIHLMMFWIAADITGAIVRKLLGKERRRNIEGACAILFTAVWLGIGWYNAHNVVRTDYTVHTEKPLPDGSLRIVGIADSHLGITLSGEDFAKEMVRVQSEAPDIVMIAGDFVDDDSCRADMIRACRALGELKTEYGVYFIFGNHDKGYYESSRDFSEDDLRDELEKNGVVVLEDETVDIQDFMTIIGRQDKREEERLGIRELTEKSDSTKFSLVLDHQPNDYENEAASGADLVFSGHTHGGHVWPAGPIGVLLGANDKVYGTETRGTTQFIVTSGISGWAIPFKTCTVSEYVVIDVKNP